MYRESRIVRGLMVYGRGEGAGGWLGETRPMRKVQGVPEGEDGVCNDGWGRNVQCEVVKKKKKKSSLVRAGGKRGGGRSDGRHEKE